MRSGKINSVKNPMRFFSSLTDMGLKDLICVRIDPHSLNFAESS